MSGPRVSCIVPTRDRPALLARALASIADQRFDDYEVLVVDDAGDESAEWVRDLPLPVRYMRLERPRGMSVARNTAIAASGGELVAYLDDDDRWYPDHLALLVDRFDESPARAVFSLAHEATEQMAPDGSVETLRRELVHNNAGFELERLLMWNLTPITCVLHERTLLDEVGAFDESLPVLEDWDLWIRMRQVTAFAHVPQVTCEYSVRDSGRVTPDRAELFGRTRALLFDRYAPLLAGSPALQAMQAKLREEALKPPNR